MIKDQPELMTIEDVSNLTGGKASQQSLRRNCRNGVLPATKINNRWYIPRDIAFSKIIKWEEESHG